MFGIEPSFLYFCRMRVKRVLLLSLVVLLSSCASLSSLSIQGADELSRRTSLPTSEDNTVRILSGGQDFYSSLLKDLSAAREYVCAEYYLIENDEVGRALMDSLASCAGRGVKTHLIYDPYGCTHARNPATKEFFKKYSERGVNIAAFNPKMNSLPRDHRKLTVIDGKTAYLGGMNWTEENICKVQGAWWTRDFTLRLEGPVLDDINTCFERVWNSLAEEKLHYRTQGGTTSSAGNVRLTVADTYGGQAAPSPEQLFLSIIEGAESEIRLVNAYFIPSARIRRAIRKAADRGVAVHILMGEDTDLPATLTPLPLRLARQLARHENIVLHLVPEVFFHAKALSSDCRTLMTGSCNLDFLSRHTNLEISLIARDSTLTSDFNRLFDSQFTSH